MLVQRRIRDAEDLEAAFSAPRYLLLKHSTVCPVSDRAFGQVEAFLDAHDDLDAGWIDVRSQRPLSVRVEERTGIQHESPQALLLRGGEVVWHASHYEVSARRLERAWDAMGKA